MKYAKYAFFTLLLLILFTTLSCQSDYTKMLNNEAKKELIKDSLIFGMQIGDTKKEFFDRCWQLNKEGKVMQGPNNMSVQHVLSNNKENANLTAINMLFYGIFDENNVMSGMNLEFSYKAWSLWNEKYQSEKLFPVVKDSIMQWFPGNAFIQIENENIRPVTFVKIDGNRQILTYIKDEKDVIVKIEDLRSKYPEKFKLRK